MFKTKITITASDIRVKNYLNPIIEKTDKDNSLKGCTIRGIKKAENKQPSRRKYGMALWNLQLYSAEYSKTLAEWQPAGDYSLKLALKRFNDNKRNRRTRKQSFMDIVSCNTDLLRFMTLTFADNVTDVCYANKHFDKFIKRLRRIAGSDFKYVCVIEFQGRGAIHYHLLHNAKYIRTKTLELMWQAGFVQNKSVDIRQTGNACAYLSMYMTKAQECEKLGAGKKAFHCSQNCLRPVVIVDNKENYLMAKAVLSDIDRSHPLYATEYGYAVNGYTNYCDVVTYRSTFKYWCGAYVALETNIPLTPCNELADIIIVKAPYVRPMVAIKFD